jgi:hypothetical protein
MFPSIRGSATVSGRRGPSRLSGSSNGLQDAFVVSEVGVRGKVIDALLVLENRIVVDRYMQCSRPGGICLRCKMSPRCANQRCRRS